MREILPSRGGLPGKVNWREDFFRGMEGAALPRDPEVILRGSGLPTLGVGLYGAILRLAALWG